MAGDPAHETEALRRHRSGVFQEKNRSKNEASVFAGERGVPFGAARRLPSGKWLLGLNLFQKEGLEGSKRRDDSARNAPALAFSFSSYLNWKYASGVLPSLSWTSSLRQVPFQARLVCQT